MKMNQENPMLDMMEKRKAGQKIGIPSYCTANSLVIEACMQQALRNQDVVLLEATANQVNQFGGYTGMRPADYRNFVYSVADRIGFPKDKIVLGGDHLGPLTWANEPEASAMEKARELVKLFVLAGYKKIHLDTSMKVADDDRNSMLSDAVIARRGAELYKACEEAYQELKKENPNEMHPVFIIGSEVPIPGGAQEKEESISVTKPEAMQKTLDTYKEEFAKLGLTDAFRYIIGIVVQPGVEFGDDEIHHYDRNAAKELCEAASRYEGIVMEGHSTDYQSAENLRRMVEDGVAILKVGPALTYSMREALFALSEMEKLLIPEEERANFIEVLEEEMLKAPGNWNKHYHGTEKEQWIKRKFSFSDRCRYYFSLPVVQKAMETLFDNMDSISIPLSMLHQYLPVQYRKVRDGVMECKARELVKDHIVELCDDYNYAVGVIR